MFGFVRGWYQVIGLIYIYGLTYTLLSYRNKNIRRVRYQAENLVVEFISSQHLNGIIRCMRGPDGKCFRLDSRIIATVVRR